MFDETPRDAYRLRFGKEPDLELPSLGRFLNHRCVREYAETPIPKDVILGLVAAGQSAATSSNLQLTTIVSIQEPDRRAKIAELCSDQAQVRNAPWFLAFFLDLHRLKKASEAVGEPCEGLDYAEFALMGAIDAALVAERMVCAAESLGIGTCYIGALRNQPDQVRDMLNMPPLTLGLFGLCLGYPAVSAKAAIKPRIATDLVFFEERYDETAGIDDYDDRMSDFYRSEGMKGEVTWSMRSGRRVDGSRMSGREALLPFLQKQGLMRR